MLRVRSLILLILLIFTLSNETATIRSPKRRTRSYVISKILNFRIFQRRPTIKSSTILPVSSDEVGSVKVTVSGNRDIDKLADFYDLMTLNPFDREQVHSQKQKNNQKDKLSNLPIEVLININGFLDSESVLSLRQVNRNLLISHIEENRSKLYSSLAPRITTNFNCLYKVTTSAYHLNSLTRPLKYLSSHDTRKIQQYIDRLPGKVSNNVIDRVKNIEKELDSVSGLDEFLLAALHFYRRTDLVAFLELFEALLKGKIINFVDVFDSLEINVNDLIFYSCKYNYLCIGKSILKEEGGMFDIDVADLYSGALSCLSSDYLSMFKVILLTLSKTSFNHGILKPLIEKAVIHKSSEYLEEIFKLFSEITIPLSFCLFTAIEVENLDMIKVILKYRGDSDFEVNNYQGYNPIELATIRNLPDAIELFSNYYEKFKEKSLDAINLAIRWKSFDALKKIIEIICSLENEFLDSIYSKSSICSFLNLAISSENLLALKLLLENISSKSLKYFYSPEFDKKIFLKDFNFNPIFLSIQVNFIDGLKALIDHFGVRALYLKDQLGRNSFLYSVTVEDYNTALLIADLNPGTGIINDIDKFGNNALHLLLNQNCPFDIIKTFADKYNFNWNQKNSSNLSPLDLLKETKELDDDQKSELDLIIKK